MDVFCAPENKTKDQMSWNQQRNAEDIPKQITPKTSKGTNSDGDMSIGIPLRHHVVFYCWTLYYDAVGESMQKFRVTSSSPR